MYVTFSGRIVATMKFEGEEKKSFDRVVFELRRIIRALKWNEDLDILLKIDHAENKKLEKAIMVDCE